MMLLEMWTSVEIDQEGRLISLVLEVSLKEC